MEKNIENELRELEPEKDYNSEIEARAALWLYLNKK